MKFREYLINENFKNLLKKEDKEKYKEEVFKMLQNTYKKVQGGLQGSGFNSPDDMVENVGMWKLGFKDNKLVSVSMYKNKFGRKRVAIAVAPGKDGIRSLSNAIEDDFKRAYGEQSGGSLKFSKKYFPELYEKYRIKAEDAIKILGLKDGDYKIKSEFEYERKIGGKFWHTKEMVGTPGKEIIYN